MNFVLFWLKHHISWKEIIFLLKNTCINNDIISLLHKSYGKLSTIITDDTISTSTLITYCAICENWQGNRLHCNVYHLRFSNYIESVQQSWSVRDVPEQLEYEQIWISTAKVLIVSSLDFVQFKNFQSQTLLNIIHNRMNSGLTTIIVCPKLNTLVGSELFFQKLQSVIRGAVITWSHQLNCKLYQKYLLQSH